MIKSILKSILASYVYDCFAELLLVLIVCTVVANRKLGMPCSVRTGSRLNSSICWFVTFFARVFFGDSFTPARRAPAQQPLEAWHKKR